MFLIIKKKKNSMVCYISFSRKLLLNFSTTWIKLLYRFISKHMSHRLYCKDIQKILNIKLYLPSCLNTGSPRCFSDFTLLLTCVYMGICLALIKRFAQCWGKEVYWDIKVPIVVETPISMSVLVHSETNWANSLNKPSTVISTQLLQHDS